MTYPVGIIFESSFKNDMNDKNDKTRNRSAYSELNILNNFLFLSFTVIPIPNEKLTFDCVVQPLTLNPPASLNLFRLSCFGFGNACSNSGRLLVKISEVLVYQIFQSID
jgi:hypothetical protein